MSTIKEHNTGHGDCPACGGVHALEIVDGDSIDISQTIKAQGKRLRWVTARHSLHATLEFWRCEKCNGGCYTVELNLIAKTDVSNDWADKYFWRNEPILDLTTVSTAKPLRAIRGVPKEWLVACIETPAGVMERHFFGPFVTGENLEGPDGVSRCSGSQAWEDAAALLGRVWPFITGACHEKTRR